MKSNEQIIRDACVAANPDIIELKFGCEIEVSDDFIPYPIVTYMREIGASKKDGAYEWEGMRNGTIWTRRKSEILKILGRPIRLADVLHGIQDAGFRKGIVTTTDKQIESIIWKWNLLQDDLSLQTEETKAILAELLK